MASISVRIVAACKGDTAYSRRKAVYAQEHCIIHSGPCGLLRPHWAADAENLTHWVGVTCIDMAVLSCDHTVYASIALCMLGFTLDLEHMPVPLAIRTPVATVTQIAGISPSYRSNDMSLWGILPRPPAQNVHDASATLSMVAAGEGWVPSPAGHEQARVALGHPGVRRVSRAGHHDARLLPGPLQHHWRVLQPRL